MHLVSAQRVEPGRWRPRVGSQRMVFERIADHREAEEGFTVVRQGMLRGGLVLHVDVLDHPQAPPLGPARGTARRGDLSEADGSCT